ncbi:putative TOS1-like glycosyl hydrolase-domain-containing protein [Lineolata rhizophorae]|uniref:glucan endo-1,3-beta-D-glucosidase n=1 Tax=Lineolata rhizophorae TaxID=578093 RepID=A0A6A6P7Q2_9PEZI|nr:putative TOS1-like glycosyl hydrolase-domain-containing protein [Lineolata rhizophorae]
MRSFLAAGSVLALAAGVGADLCNLGSELIGGNWYCQKVDRVSYQGVGGAGSFNRVTNMDADSGSCSSQPEHYSGSLAPLNEDISLHIRGPFHLKQLAVYTPSSASESSKKTRRTPHERRHGHAHFHEHNKEIRELHKVKNTAQAEEKRDIGDWVTVTWANGDVVSWINEYDGSPATTAPAAPADTTAAAVEAADYSAETSSAQASSTKASSTGASSAATPAASGDWTQVAYYNAEEGTATGLTFLANLGGGGSGVFDYTFGNSLSYVSSDGQSCASSPQVLDDVLLPSNTEIAIMSDRECSEGSCGYVRPGSVAYEGFGGSDKAFFIEFSMPYDGKTGWNEDMGAFWGLNAQIPRTLQYGQADCSCWTTGCGEADFFEVLDSGNHRMKSTIHGNNAGGSSDWFQRPGDSFMKAVVVFKDDNLTIQVLDDDTEFGTSMPQSTIEDICSDEDVPDILNSIFAMAGSAGR